WVLAAIIVAIIAAIAVSIWATRVRTATGRYPTQVVFAAKIADAVVSFLVALLGFSLLANMVPGFSSTVVLIASLVVAGVSLTRLAPFGRAAIAFVFGLTVLYGLLTSMFPTVQPLLLAAGSALAGLTFAWISYEGSANRPASEGRFPLGLLILIAVGIPAFVYWATGAQLAFELPVLERFNFKGGVQLPPELVALVFGLTIYTAAFIAENVRGGIRAVSKGQTEAAQSLGLKEGDRLRLVIIPQAMRVIVPPLTSQYLNLTKNSSLGAAIGYPELVNVFTGTTLNQTGKAIEVIALTMAVYLTFSLLTSAFMNWYNGRVALVER
ncbi:MAG TPA: ABC transporter permease subunit, partial [Devosia sp.]